MELLSETDIKSIVRQFEVDNVISWRTQEFEDKVIGYLGDHLKLIIDVESKGLKSIIVLFIKCIPRFDKWKAQYIREVGFLNKEYIMLSTVFKEFQNYEGTRKWRPNLLLIRENVFVFENVTEMGYVMPYHRQTMQFDALKAVVETLGRFHAQSYIYEENKSKQLGRVYRIWEDYSEYLQEPVKGLDWRDTGRNAVIEFLKSYSRFRAEPSFSSHLELVIPMLYDGAMALMKPSAEYRNVIIHRDLWTNNIFISKKENTYHALFVDFQTVLYCSPMLDLSSLIFFNTTRSNRYLYTDDLINIYYRTLSEELRLEGIDIESIIDKATLIKSYKESVMFGITQAALIVPLIAMDSKSRQEIFGNPETSKYVNVVSRSECFIKIAKEDGDYRKRVTELFDEIVERYIYPNESNQHLGDKY